MTTEYENALRKIIIYLVGDNDDSPYQISNGRIEKWKEKRNEELKKYNDTLTERRLIYYSDFYDLESIITKNWTIFKPVFHDKKRFEVFFKEISKYRNTVAHGRNISGTQENLIKGITSDLKNLITIYYNKNEMKDDYFIRILKINDNLGNIWEGDKSPKMNPILRVGDEYEITIDAVDPKDRKIEYSIKEMNGFLITQSENRIKIKFENKSVGENIWFVVGAKTPESDYKNQALKNIILTILPE